MNSNIDKDNKFIQDKVLDIFYQNEEFELIKGNYVYKIIVCKSKDNILMKYKNYEILLNNNDLSILAKIPMNTIDEAYEYIVEQFEYHKVIIKDIRIKVSITLLFNLNIEQNKKIEFSLGYKSGNFTIINDLNYYSKEYFNKINDEMNLVKDEMNLVKEEINLVKDEIVSLKNEMEINKDNNNYININNKENENDNQNDNKNNNGNDLEFQCDITKDAYSNLYLSDTFSVFESLNKILYLVYSNKKKSIMFYDLINNKNLKEIQNSHMKYITNLRHYLDKIIKRDLLLSISGEDHNIKVWNIDNDKFDCLVDIKNVNTNGFLYSACILNENNRNYIISSHYYTKNNYCENIKVFDFDQTKIKEINNSNYMTYYIDSYYDKKSKKNYILTCNEGFIKSYDYNINDVYKQYCDSDDNNKGHFNMIVTECKGIIEIIESSFDGNIRIWDFHSGKLLNKIKICDDCIREICLWNKEYIFIGCDDKTIKLVKIDNGTIIKELEGHKNYVISLKQIIHPKYGQCLISQGLFSDNIKLWINKNYNK